MCEACERGEAGEAIGPALLRRARGIEAALPGERVPEEAWHILTGRGGAIAWSDHLRMLRCLEEAATNTPRPGGLRCDAIMERN
ncbi:hypothetical protein [Roseomonas sp. BN140053]|uniref:hypothetical protein n=1 Tax=Roseomonas sp. BN140053 TaxID=3391898 RepID=UPI0039E8A33B